MSEKRTFLPMMWPEGEPNLGEGVSRPKDSARTRLYNLLVTFSSARPMRMTLQAETKRHAMKYAKARWPEATIEILE